jgi:hypothetical protein
VHNIGEPGRREFSSTRDLPRVLNIHHKQWRIQQALDQQNADMPEDSSPKLAEFCGDLDARQTPTVPAWKLREQMKAQGPVVRSARKPLPTTKPDLDGGEDPNLPPAFRAAFRAQRKKGVDAFESLASVHTTSSATRMTENDSDSDDSFDGQDSFASLGEEDDDEAYREGRNQMARLTIETTRRSPTKTIRSLRKPGGVLGKPLDFIAE